MGKVILKKKFIGLAYLKFDKYCNTVAYTKINKHDVFKKVIFFWEKCGNHPHSKLKQFRITYEGYYVR